MTMCHFTMEAALRFAADTGGEIVIALDEGKRFMTTLMGEYSKGPTSAREKSTCGEQRNAAGAACHGSPCRARTRGPAGIAASAA